MVALIVSVAFVYVLVCVLAVLVIVLYRQFGLVYVGSRRSYEMAGPPVGERAPSGLWVVSPHRAEASLALDWTGPPGSATLLLLGGAACPLCEGLLHHMDDALPAELGAVRVLFIDKDPGGVPVAVPASRTGRWQHWRSADGSVHAAFDVAVSPFAIVIDHEGIIRAKKIVSSPQAVLALLDEAGLSAGPAVAGAQAPDLLSPQATS